MHHEHNHVRELLQGFDTAMLVTHLPNGHLRSRPMAIAQKGEAGDLWFATRVDSPKVDEIQGDHDVNVTCQKEDRFLSLSGTAELIQDREALDRLWDEAWRAWFPDGTESQQLALIHVIPHEADAGKCGLLRLAGRKDPVHVSRRHWPRVRARLQRD